MFSKLSVKNIVTPFNNKSNTLYNISCDCNYIVCDLYLATSIQRSYDSF